MKKIINNLLFNSKSKVVDIEIEKVLRGPEGDDLTGIDYVKMTGDIFRLSTRAIDGPQVKLIKEYEEFGDKIFEGSYFYNTDYYKNAFQSICYLGDYFPEAKSPDLIVEVAKNFINSYLEYPVIPSKIGHNSYNEPIVVKRIYKSDCFQLLSGNHRIASRFLKGERKIKALILPGVAHTYFTNMIADVIWDNGEVLYQPINLPEINHLPIIRNCSDRFEKSVNFLSESEFDISKFSLLDIGSYYGWFVDSYRKIGVDAYGLERDFSACKISHSLYDIPSSKIINCPIEQFLASDNNVKYDCINFLSVLHHFTLKKSFMSDVEVFSKFANMTRKVMFFETGEEHEKMFGSSLAGSNVESIEKFIFENSDFTKVIRLGRDSDNIGIHSDDYRRMLFALVK
jgi:hypothetical protein